jgi:hypothetical protein
MDEARASRGPGAGSYFPRIKRASGHLVGPSALRSQRAAARGRRRQGSAIGLEIVGFQWANGRPHWPKPTKFPAICGPYTVRFNRQKGLDLRGFRLHQAQLEDCLPCRRSRRRVPSAASGSDASAPGRPHELLARGVPGGSRWVRGTSSPVDHQTGLRDTRIHARAILNRDGRMIRDDWSNDERRARQRPPEDRPADLRERMMSTADQTRETRLRRMADRQGSRSRSPGAAILARSTSTAG